jgi:hypothetical protein
MGFVNLLFYAGIIRKSAKGSPLAQAAFHLAHNAASGAVSPTT